MAQSAYVNRVRAAFILALLSSVCHAAPAPAMPRRVPLLPADTQVEFRAYGMGLVPIDASFARFDGWLTYDPENTAFCQVELRVDVASLVTEDMSMRAMILGTDFMDAARFPGLSYVGVCTANDLGGRLSMHGVARPFALSLEWRADGVVAEGRLVRADWGMTARPLLGGRTVRIRVTVPLHGSREQTSHPG